MSRLTLSGVDVGQAECALTRAARRRGLLGRDGIDGVLVLEPCRSVHTIGMRFSIDVAHCSGSTATGLVVDGVRTMRPGRLGVPHLRSRCVVEAAAGFFSSVGISAGDRLEIRP